jgi:asparagine synthase (glutamine-hydrolysing)
MCGIVAQHGRSDQGELDAMLVRLTPPRPGRRGHRHVDGAWLGHRRLSIVDVGGGRQPLVNAGGDLFLVGNGEIYNHEEMRAELPGPAPRTASDNEVALALVRGPRGARASPG